MLLYSLCFKIKYNYMPFYAKHYCFQKKKKKGKKTRTYFFFKKKKQNYYVIVFDKKKIENVSIFFYV